MTKPITKPIKYIHSITIHNNGKGRKRKVMAHTDQGIVSARRAYYSLYHKDWDRKGKVIHLDNNDLNFDETNLVLLTTRECNNVVHFNNTLIIDNDPELQKVAIKLVRLRIALHDTEKGGEKYDK